MHLSSYENKKNETYDLQHQLSFSVVSEVSKESIDWRSQRFSRENYKRGMFTERLGDYKYISSARPPSYIYFCLSDICSDVCSQSSEGSNCNQGDEGTSFCQEILESGLLCWNSGHSHRTDNSEIYSRTRNEVNKSQFTTATKDCSVPLRHELWNSSS